jgi:hypothetical protein
MMAAVEEEADAFNECDSSAMSMALGGLAAANLSLVAREQRFFLHLKHACSCYCRSAFTQLILIILFPLSVFESAFPGVIAKSEISMVLLIAAQMTGTEA